MAEPEKQIDPTFEQLRKLRAEHPEAYALLPGGLRYNVAHYHEPHDPTGEQTFVAWRAAAGLGGGDGTTIRVLPDVQPGMVRDVRLEVLLITRWLHPLVWQRFDQGLQEVCERYSALRATGQVQV
jgi:hypothetical protein